MTSVAVSLCGNFGVLGYINGMISKFNMQSGKDRGPFTCDREKGEHLHSSEVTGLAIDSLNKHLVSGSTDKSIKLWDFYRCKLLRTFQTDYSVENICYNRENDLLAFSTSDLSITLLNPKSGLKKVRVFPNAAQNKINDICFSYPDSKWLLCSSMDRSIRVWDIITGCLVDWIQFKSAPLSIDFSPSGEFLATSHQNSKAVYLWSNRAFYQQIVVQKVPTAPTLIDMPSLNSSETTKQSHKDFYHTMQKGQAAPSDDEKSLI